MKPTTTDREAAEWRSGSKPGATGRAQTHPAAALRAFAPNIWIVDGSNVRDFGVLFTTRMIIVKLADDWPSSACSVMV